MVTVDKQIKDFDELEFPETIYKYRTWNDPFHKKILTEQEIYFSNPKSFEDKEDCKIPTRFDLLTDDEIFQKYYSEAYRFHPLRPATWHFEFATWWTNSSPIKDLERFNELQIHGFDEFNKRIGILSLTANPNSLAMWDKYSNNRKGICVGFDPKIMFKYLGGGGQVQYFDELPIIWPTPKHSFEDQIYLQTFSKLRKWEFEQEYRTQVFSYNGLTNDQRKVKLPIEAFKTILLGSEMTDKDEDEIRKIANQNFGHVKVRKIKVENETVTM